MSKERARRRAERERLAAEAAAQRAAEEERRRRRRARVQVLTRWTPRPGSRQTGTLAARRRRDAGLVLALVFAVNLLVWLAVEGWAARAMALVLSLLLAPVALILVEKK